MEQVQVRQPNLVANWRHVMRTCNPPKELDPVSRWLVLTRACVQPMTLTAAAFAGLLAVRAPRFNLGLWLLASIEVGSDTRDYPRALYAPQAVLSGLITRRGLIRAALVINLTDLVILAVLALLRGPLVIFFALAGLLISVGYAAPPLRLKQHGLGEPGVFLTWGPLMIGGTYYSATGHLSWLVLLASVPYALLTTSVLMGKHIDKIPWDSKLGIGTLPVQMGEGAARRLTEGMMIAFYVAVVALVAARVLSRLSPGAWAWRPRAGEATV